METQQVLIAPSLLSADFGNLKSDIKRMEDAGADWLHIDVMDGHFVPNITIGPVVVSSVKKISKLPLDVHLMIKQPERYIKAFAEAGSDLITFHIEAARNPASLMAQIKAQGKKAGISIKPDTKVARIRRYLAQADLVLVMSVEPGFGGQEFINGALKKIKELKEIYGGMISVDGGINGENAASVRAAGANVLVAGSYLFGAVDVNEAIGRLRR
ncbi:MAG: ribulose-phosphate 3-epimerase [Candidatus Omnitrophica bacterium]|nr:ribulose-phosphate 3-epimerase [Candidatus Omnitrophota bacterium]